ncbi:hypothetical protein X737_32195 [Mesorhizobium sp. L48C026A00]|nr:hypothetical protein X737_32195 [Mesorhizobium sp. L48C026A00]
MLLRVAATLCLWLAVAVAATALEVDMTDGGAVVWPVQSDGPTLHAQIIIRNASSAERRLAPAAELVRDDDHSRVIADWALAEPLGEGGILPANGEATYTLSATLPRPGKYMTEITGHVPGTAGAEGRVWRIGILLNRAVTPIGGPTATLTTNPTQITFGPFGGVDGGIVKITMRNAGTEPIEFLEPAVFTTTALTGGTDLGLKSTGQPSVNLGNCTSPLAAGAACALELNPGALPGPGDYRVGVGLAGTGGGWVEATQVVNARWHWTWAFLVVVIGVVSGWILQNWRTSGKPAAEALIALAPVADRLKALALTVTDAEFMSKVERLDAELRAAEGRIRASGPTAGEVGRLAARVQQLAEASGPWHAFKKMSADAQAFLAERWSPIADKLDAPWSEEPDPGAFRSSLRLLGDDIRSWQQIVTQRSRAARLEAALRGLGAAETDGTAAKTLAVELRTATNAVDDGGPLPASGESAATRAGKIKAIVDAKEIEAYALADASKQILLKAIATLGADPGAKALEAKVRALVLPSAGIVEDLQALATLCREHHEVTAAIAAAAGVVAADAQAIEPINVPGLPQVTLPPSFLLPPPGSSVESLLRTVRRNNLIMTAIVALMAGLVGVATLWATDPTWGGISSLITAYVGGAASRIVVGDAGG